jgi:hypothetical protein
MQDQSSGKRRQSFAEGLRRDRGLLSRDRDGRRFQFICAPVVAQASRGVDQGMGAAVLCAALARNALEGHIGRYYGTDINPDAGYYLQLPYSNYGKVLYGDSLASLKVLDETVDLFVNDSDHSEGYEQAEYELIKGKISTSAILLGDNSHVTSELAEFSIREGRRFVFLFEEPAKHWYRGAGIGVSFPK